MAAIAMMVKHLTSHVLTNDLEAKDRQLVASVMALKRSVLPPTINLQNPDPQCDLDYVPNVARDAKVRRAMSNSFGFGGHNACILVGQME